MLFSFGKDAMSTHRLLPTIVFASSSLLACGGQIDAVLDGPDAPGPPADGSADAVTKPDAAKDAPGPDVAPITDAGADVRSCEGGWPTTKGQICTFEAGIACCTPSLDQDGGEVICCATGGQ